MIASRIAGSSERKKQQRSETVFAETGNQLKGLINLPELYSYSKRHVGRRAGMTFGGCIFCCFGSVERRVLLRVFFLDFEGIDLAVV